MELSLEVINEGVLEDFYKKYYVVFNMVVVIIGVIDCIDVELIVF